MMIIRNLSLLFFFMLSMTPGKAQNNCEQISTLSLEKLISLLKKNDVPNILTIMNTIEANCGENEFTLRTRLIYQVINKENTDAIYTRYIKNKFDETLIKRWDNASDTDYQNIYAKNKKSFNFVPLRHPTDSLLKIKASAILNSPSYSTINNNDVAILHLFADDIDAYLNIMQPKSAPDKKMKERIENEQHKEKNTFGVHAGSFMPIGENIYFKNSFTGGLSYMSPFINDFVFDVHYKFRIHSNAPAFDFMYKDELREVASNSSHVVAVGLGYKLLDKSRFIILPKVNIGYGVIWTGLSETVYGEDDEGNETEFMQLRNVQTLHSSLGIALMRHIKNKTYIGVESNVHLVPYTWDGRLHSTIPSKYASLEFFVRF
ncbi:hypothetical protein [Sphingobacterium bovistauri]|uniref:Outer membrane protein beta-barrel domain-containing protein n=1 Tax=Sphingobacterium bovistauri TaxID=2781959 RepID=A0ABS7ZB97_9SPHI|nr:hypothetical protein [Sphingobacterium bovistauri]MCA5006204.1 hypothetical protein [Sphingobacterium bovistauri]